VALALLVLAVSAASITATNQTYQAEIGGAMNVNNKLVGIDKGFAKASSGASASGTGSCATPVLFTITPGANATTVVTSGHYVYDVQITNTTLTPALTCYQVLLTLHPSGGPLTTYGPLFIQTTVAAAWQPLDARFDIQSTTAPTSPFSFLITITCQLGTCP
jgi:hypothetical protein